MKASAKNLLTIIKEPKQFVIPIYQRTYSWQIKQCNQLLLDILDIEKNGDQGHFIGSIVYFQPSIHTIAEIPEYMVIDGQQRLTTVSLLIAAIAKFLEDNPSVSIDTTVKKLQNYYLFNAEEENNLYFKLLLTRRDKDTYIQLINNHPLPEKPSQRIIENYEFFFSKIDKDNISKIYNGVQRLFVVDVALEREKDNPQLIFESLNSTGLDLSQADLIRNFVLMGQPKEIQSALYEGFWYPMEQSFGENLENLKWFIRDYLTMKLSSIPKIEMVYETFKSFLNSDISPDGISDAIKDLYGFSKYYVNMVLHKEKDQDLLKPFKDLSRLKVDVSYPLLLAIYNDFQEGVITKDEFVKNVRLVESYVFRRAICGIPTNSLNKTFATFYKSIDKSDYLNSVKANFVLMDGYRRFPSDTELESAIISKDVYNFRSRNYLLEKIENFSTKEFVNVESYTIEHVMPQTMTPEWQTQLGENWEAIHEKYLHTIGNLTLTGYNPDMSNKSFTEKRNHEKGFKNSPFYLNEYIRSVETWNEENISKRTEILGKKISAIWGFPEIDKTVLENIKNKPVKEAGDYSIESYEHLKGDMLALFQTLSKRILNIGSGVKQEFAKTFVAFKVITNFVELDLQKSQPRLLLNIEFGQIKDEKGICKEVTEVRRWHNGGAEVELSNESDLEYVMDLIHQAYEEQLN